MDNEKLKEQSLNLNVSDSDSDTSAESAAECPPAVEVSGEMTLSEEVRQAELQRRRTRAATSGDSKSDLLTFSFVGLIFFCFFSMMTYSTIWSYPWQSSWARVDGEVTNIRIGNKILDRWVDYSYPVGTETYSGKENFQLHGNFMFYKEKVTVRYNPKAPRFSTIETGPTLATFIWLMFALVCLPVFTGCLHEYRDRISLSDPALSKS